MKEFLKVIGTFLYMIGISLFIASSFSTSPAPLTMFIVNFLGAGMFLSASVIYEKDMVGFYSVIFVIQTVCLILKVLIM